MYLNVPVKRCLLGAMVSTGIGVALFLTIAEAQDAQPGETVAELTAQFVDGGSGNGVQISVIRWSTDEERGRLVTAIDTPPPPPAPPAAGGRGGRGGRGGFGGRGGGEPAEPVDLVAEAVNRAPTLGYIWRAGSVIGHSIKYAYEEPLPGGGERIVLVTNRRLTPQTTIEEELMLTEIRLDASGSGEARMAMLSEASTDSQAQTVTLEDYDATPAILQSVRR